MDQAGGSARRRSRMLAGLAALGLLLALPTACGGGDAESRTGAEAVLSRVRVTGDVGERPRLTFATPLRVAESGFRVLVPGRGAPIQDDGQFLLQLTLVDARTGHVAVSTLDRGQTPRTLRAADEDLFPVLRTALAGQRQGARVLVAAAAKDAYADAGAPQYQIKPGDALLMVADVIAVPPTKVLEGPIGAAIPPPKAAPRLHQSDGVVDRLLFGTAPRPRKLTVIPLIEGSGPPARANSLITIDYLGQLWGTGRVFASTYGKEPMTFALGTDSVVKAWDQALVGVRRGSRLLVLTPPGLAYHHAGQPPSIPGDATLGYVIDVLGVS